MLKMVLTSSLILVAVCPAESSVLFLESGHYVWTDATPYYDEVFLQNDASLDFVGGLMGHLATWDNSLAYIDGGSMQYLSTYDNTVVTLYSAALDWIVSAQESKVYLYAYDVTYYPAGGINGDGLVQGYFYKDDSQFSFSCWNESTYSHVHIVPEPGALLLLALGALIARRTNQPKTISRRNHNGPRETSSEHMLFGRSWS
jgi:hypothetical protein